MEGVEGGREGVKGEREGGRKREWGREASVIQSPSGYHLRST